MKVCVIIPAAGKSQRFGSTDKLAQDLGGRPLLMRTVELFTKRQEVSSIIVAAPPDNIEEFRDKYGAALGFHGAQIVSGAKVERCETVKNALSFVPEDCTHIAIHDAARPAASKSLLDRIFEAGRSLDAVVPAVEITATVKRVSDKQTDVADDKDSAVVDAILGDADRPTIPARKITETVDRAGLVEVQTPQLFKADLLRQAYAQDDLSNATDDSMLVERLGENVFVVEGDVSNVKVTRKGDIKLVRALLGLKAPSQRPVHKRF